MRHVMKYGLVHNDSPFASDSFVPIGDMSVMDARSTKQLPDGSFLSEYIPFYFGPRSPMLYNIQNGNGILTKKEPDEIVYCVIRIEDVINSDLHCVFTDGHALNNMSKFYSKSDLQRLDSLVKMEDVYATYSIGSINLHGTIENEKKRQNYCLRMKFHLNLL